MIKLFLYLVLIIVSSSIFVNAFDPSLYEEDVNEEDLASNDENSSQNSFDPSLYEEDVNEEDLASNGTSEQPMVDNEDLTEDNSETDSEVREGFSLMVGFSIFILVLALLVLLYSIYYYRKKKRQN